MPARLLVCAAALLCLGRVQPAAAGATPDRLDRFRELARTRLEAADAMGGERARALYRELYGLLDAEIVESLDSGGVFASEGFLQERLDAFTEAWGGAALRVVAWGPVVVGAFHLADATAANSLRVYGRRGGEAALLAAIERDGTPTLYPTPPAGGAPQFLVVWEGARTARGTTPVRIDLMRQAGGAVRSAWSTADVLGDDVETWSYTVRGGAIALRYELRYPGWVPGCDGQTEAADTYRYLARRRTFVRAERRLINPWHREFRAEVERFFAALRAGDRPALRRLVPDARLRAALPPGLEPEPACDAVEGAPPAAVSVAAARGREPWALTFRRAGAGWRLQAAGLVIR